MRMNHSLQWLVAAIAAQQTLAFAHIPNHPSYIKRDDPARGPCPALNVLANEGVLPQDGRNITADMFKSAIMSVYNLDDNLAGILSSGAIRLCGESGATAINLDDLDKHNEIEHDASLTRNDIIQGDNHSMQPQLLQAVLDDADGDFVSAQSLGKSRVRRGQESQAAGSPPLGLRAALAYGEASLLLQALGHLGNGTATDPQVPKEALQTWIGQEKLPDGWSVPPNQITLASTALIQAKVQAAATFS